MTLALKKKLAVAFILVVALVLIVVVAIYPELSSRVVAASVVVAGALGALVKKRGKPQAAPQVVEKETEAAEEAAHAVEQEVRKEVQDQPAPAVVAAADADGHLGRARDDAARAADAGADYPGKILDRSAEEVQRIFGDPGDSGHPQGG